MDHFQIKVMSSAVWRYSLLSHRRQSKYWSCQLA